MSKKRKKRIISKKKSVSLNSRKNSFNRINFPILFFLFLIVCFLYYFIFPFKNYQPHNNENLVQKKHNLEKKIIIPDVLEHGDRNLKEVAITFDADMTPSMSLMLKNGIEKSLYNREAINTLRREQVHATIFLTGLWTETYPEEAKSIADDNLFEIGNHSFSHPAFASNCYKLPVININQDMSEIEDAQKVIQKVTGIVPKYFRFPGGCYTKDNLEIVKKSFLKTVQWDVVSGDAFNNNTDAIVSNVLNGTRNGSIIVFHLNYGSYAPKTNDALIKIIPELRGKGFRFVTISKLIEDEKLNFSF